jgi:transposase
MLNVPLLPAPVKSIRDAARAVKRLAGQVIQTVAEATLSQFLDLPEFRVLGYALEEQGEIRIVHLYCEHRYEVALCPRCRTPSTKGHEYKERCVRDLDLVGRHTFLHFISRRFDCEQCGRPFTEELPSIDRCRRQSCRFELYIYQRCLSASRKEVAEQEWLDQSTVTDILKRWTKRAAKARTRLLVRVLGIDEITLKKHHEQFALVLSDLERRCVIAVLDDRRKEALEKWFDQLSPEERQAICVVSIDMWEPYYLAVKAKLPHATIVADRFHVMRQLNERLTQMRRAIQARADEATCEVLKGSRWILVKNRDELTEKEALKLAEVLAACPELRTLYLLKEEFRLIFEKVQDRDQAARFLRVWIYKAQHTGDKYLLKFVATLLNWWEEILNYFIERVTNGFVEGMNRAIRAIIRRACGYRNFDNFRLQVLAEHGPSG